MWWLLPSDHHLPAHTLIKKKIFVVGAACYFFNTLHEITVRYFQQWFHQYSAEIYINSIISSCHSLGRHVKSLSLGAVISTGEWNFHHHFYISVMWFIMFLFILFVYILSICISCHSFSRYILNLSLGVWWSFLTVISAFNHLLFCPAILIFHLPVVFSHSVDMLLVCHWVQWILQINELTTAILEYPYFAVSGIN